MLSREFKVARKYLDKTVNTIHRRNSPGLHKALKRLGAASGKISQGSFQLKEHEGFTDQEVTEDLAQFFSQDLEGIFSLTGDSYFNYC